MAGTHHEFDREKIQDVLDTAQRHYADRASTALVDASDDGHLSLAAGCISVNVENHKVCVVLPLNLGKYCFPIPGFIPDGTAAEACLSICTTFGFPTGVRVTVSVLGKVIASKSFGKC